MTDEILLTQAGLDSVISEHDRLVAEGRTEVSEKLKEAISYGDLSENAEYDAAKNEQAELEQKILQLEDIIRRAKIIDESEINSDNVSVGNVVNILDEADSEVMTFKIVGVTEADPLEGRISNESPVGKALLNKATGETVEVVIPDGSIVKYTILSITK